MIVVTRVTQAAVTQGCAFSPRILRGLAMTGGTLYTPVSTRDVQYTNLANQHSFMRSRTHLKRLISDRERVLEKRNRPP
jgi:hypothetical protein